MKATAIIDATATTASLLGPESSCPACKRRVRAGLRPSIASSCPIARMGNGCRPEPEAERVAARHPGYWIVEKTGRAKEIVEGLQERGS